MEKIDILRHFSGKRSCGIRRYFDQWAALFLGRELPPPICPIDAIELLPEDS